ncbi:hypothetical protein [Halobacillus naozhouensis]|uniref:Protein kinase domain-containing protein n=1 Tax=Halobacillus naozhouensis TaxID=554880 RepID=A0ABY8J1Q7_9BACI|nr:hypothetical protein [Halobacillus naozhouensis]WFT75507.1 hypothetical protein P9989_03670 [Halobacillus naozhouensis]
MSQMSRGELPHSTFLTKKEWRSIELWLYTMEKYGHYSDDRLARKAKKKMGLSYDVLGHGSFRVVFDLNNDYVLKVVTRRMGFISNEIEMDLFRECPKHLRNYLCPVYEFGHGWIIMRKMIRTVSMEERDHRKKLVKLEDDFLKEGIHPGDLNEENLALSRTGKLVVIDYGHFSKADFWW